MMTKMTPILMLTIMSSLILSSNPLFLGVNILILAFSISFFMSLFTNSWLAMATFIIYIGAMLVLFAYFLATQPNTIILNSKMVIKLFLTFMLLASASNSMITNSLAKTDLSMMMIMHNPNLPMIMLIGGILLLIMIVIVSMITEDKSPLRPYK